MTSVGALTDASRSLRLPDARIARSCRATPAGFSPRSKVRSARERSRASSWGKLPTRAPPQYQEHRLGVGAAEDFVAEVDAVGAGELRRLVGERIHRAVPLGNGLSI